MKLINRKQGTFTCGGYTFPTNVPVEVPNELAEHLLRKPSLLLEIYKEDENGKEEAQEEKRQKIGK
ncbi:MAG: hypothetical protein RMJ67_08540 [Elusimicrobiota bacterium]|nr:hypothetical protein [Endomicrobiia bacterium]MDW8166543.1 hypothetical protein [Elusimicrobiota bacterium]